MIDPDRFLGLLDRHGAGLELFARQFCDGAEDVVQEAFIELASQREPPRHVAAWLYATVKNRALSAARAKGRRDRHERTAADRVPAWFEPQLDDRLDAQAAAHALSELADHEREPIVMHLWGGLSFEDIAAASGVSASTAHRRYAEGLQSLRKRLGLDIEVLCVEGVK